MFSFLCFAALLFYFWYFYYLPLPSHPLPTTASPSPPPASRLKLYRKKHPPNTFVFLLDLTPVWEHTLPQDTYVIKARDISRKNPCYPYSGHGRVLATGLPLYHYVKHHSGTQDLVAFQKETPYTQPEGDVFYFNCANRQIESVGICPSGTLFKGSRCVPIGPCTGQPEGKRLPDPQRSTHYIVCHSEQPTYFSCGKDQFFYQNRCVSLHDLSVFCKREPPPLPLRIDSTTLATCVEGQVVYQHCAEGTQFFDTNTCESTLCLGQPDWARVPLPDQTVELFRFSPGYATCVEERVVDTDHCPKKWDTWQAEEDLTFLPQVWEGHQCSVPSLCDNVQPIDPEVIVPAYDFNKKVSHWKLSNLYDTAVGYTCVNGQKRRQVLPSGVRIKKFKRADGCEANVPRLPILDQPERYYDCTLRAEQACPPNEYFNGETCLLRPLHAFTHHQLPLFELDALNEESWIRPWVYLPPAPPRVCQAPDELLSVYDVCSHPDCTPYAFLTLVQNASILLPQALFQCRFDAQARRLVKEPFSMFHRFWDQRVVDEPPPDPEPCVPGQNLQTGHFVWDRTIYATCDPTQPFVFCPSVHTSRIVSVFGDYACDTALSNTIEVQGPISFLENEARRLQPHPKHLVNRFKLNHSRRWILLPDQGFEVPPTERVDMLTIYPLQVKLRYRVTYPPHIYLEYDETDRLHRKTTSKGAGFLVHKEKPTTLGLAFPTYTPIPHVPSFLP